MHNKNCVKSSDVPSTPPQSQEVHIPESHDLYIAKETNQGIRSSDEIFEKTDNRTVKYKFFTK